MDYLTMAENDTVIFRMSKGAVKNNDLFLADIHSHECLSVAVNSLSHKLELISDISQAVKNNSSMQQIKLLVADFIDANK